MITKKKEENTITELLQLACSFSCDILIESEKKKFNPKSLLGIMKFELKENVEAVISANGVDENEAVNMIESYLCSTSQ